MSLGFLDRDALTQKVADDVGDREYGCSWNLGIPPCFEATETLDLVVSKLIQRPGVVVADLTSDTLPDLDAYIRRLYDQWSSRIELPPLRIAAPDAMFDYLVASLPGDLIFVQVVRQFHKIIDFLGVQFLGQLRDAEQRRSIRTVTATPLIIPDLKKRWDRQHPCTVSGYGVGHAEQYVQPFPPAYVIEFLEKQGIGKGVAKYLCAQTGGYPECVTEVVKVLRRTNSKSLTPEIKTQLKAAAINGLRRFIDLMDDASQTTYRDTLIDLYHGVECDDAIERCKVHPWARVLLNDVDDLRAEYLGEAAVTDMLRDSVVESERGPSGQDRFSRAAKIYGMRKFVDAGRMFHAMSVNRPDFEVTKANAAVMQCLYSEDTPGEDSDWLGVVSAAKRARQALFGMEAFKKMAPFLSERLERIERIGSNIVALQKKGEKRVVDALAGLRPSSHRCDETAAFLLLCKFETCNAISGHAAACQASLALPEQLLRVWAFWKLGVNYYSTPDNADGIWESAEAEWPSQLGALRRSMPAEPFPSLVAFGYFAFAAAKQSGLTDDQLPVEGFPELRSVFTSYEQLRNPQAHSYCFTSRKEREQFFLVADRWLNCVLSVCPAQTTRNDLIELIEPLPLLSRDGEVLCY